MDFLLFHHYYFCYFMVPETLEPSWNIEPNRTELNFFNISMFLCTDKNGQMHQIHHVNAFKYKKQSSVRSNYHKNIKILNKFGFCELMFNSVRLKKRGKLYRVSL
jgi:hypothetical protein